MFNSINDEEGKYFYRIPKHFLSVEIHYFGCIALSATVMSTKNYYNMKCSYRQFTKERQSKYSSMLFSFDEIICDTFRLCKPEILHERYAMMCTRTYGKLLSTLTLTMIHMRNLTTCHHVQTTIPAQHKIKKSQIMQTKVSIVNELQADEMLNIKEKASRGMR
ncbi:CLUMA_CG003891, isoform A [Clunio marinus]|uniref:CLUMA_CG003891, isoform A n=1 Tax=Clunio marinus TaxID=568069 RepID=A0A1J1HVK0_9DIPT|nr:CLUMA_CG003891, isoform A [Clunio marinus]